MNRTHQKKGFVGLLAKILGDIETVVVRQVQFSETCRICLLLHRFKEECNKNTDQKVIFIINESKERTVPHKDID